MADRSSSRRYVEASALVAIVAAATLGRLALLEWHGLWADEIFTLAVATGHSLEHPAAAADPALGDFVERQTAASAATWQHYLTHDTPPAGIRRLTRALLMSDTSPPLYYLLVSVWLRLFGSSDAALRGFSLLCAMACFPLLWHLARRWPGPAAAWWTCLLFAAAPVSVYYGTEGRMYALVWFLSASLMALTLVPPARTRDVRWVAMWVVVGTVGLLTHYFYAFVWLACLTWLVVYREVSVRVLVVVLALTAVAVLPWYSLVPESVSRWRVTGYWLIGETTWTERLRAPAELLSSFFAGRGSWGGSRSASVAVAAACGATAIHVLARSGWRRLATPSNVLLVLCAVAPCVGLVAFDVMRGTRAAFVPRYALAGMPAAFLLAGVGLSLAAPAVRAVALAVIVLAWSSGMWAMFRSPSRNGEPFREVAVGLDARLASDLVLVHSVPSGVLGIARYAPPQLAVAAWVAQLGQRRVPEDVQRLTEGRARVVFVNIHAVGAPAHEEEWLRANARVVRDVREQTARIVVFEPRTGTYFSW